MMKSFLLFLVLFVNTISYSQVKMSEETITLPTYETKSPDKIPLFFRSEEVQLAEKHIYPYPFIDVQSGDKVDKTYKAVILENEYIKICVTPEMGGRLYYALDKTNNYEIVYNNRVVKPALRHRVILNFEGEAEALDIEQLIDELLENVPTPDREAAV